MSIVLAASSFNYSKIVMSQKHCIFLASFLPSFIMFMISASAETNRAPFDLPEAEGELVAAIMLSTQQSLCIFLYS